MRFSLGDELIVTETDLSFCEKGQVFIVERMDKYHYEDRDGTIIASDYEVELLSGKQFILS